MFLTVEEAAPLLHTTPDTIRRKAAAGTMPGRKVGRRWLFDPDQLKEYVRGTWRSTNERPGVPGGLDSQLVVNLFADPLAQPIGRGRKNSRPHLERATGGRKS